MVVGFAGLALLLLPEGRAEAADWGPTLLVVVAAGSTAIGSFYSNRWDVPSNTLVATVIEMLAAGIALIVAAAVTGELGDASVIDVSSSSLIAFAYLVTFGSLLAYSAFVWLLDNAPVSLVSTYAYVNPVIALILGVLLLNEDVSALMSLGAVAIVVSVVAVVRTSATSQRQTLPTMHRTPQLRRFGEEVAPKVRDAVARHAPDEDRLKGAT